MITFTCNECGTLITPQQVIGTLPLSVPLNAYCSDKCLSENVEKNKPKPNA